MPMHYDFNFCVSVRDLSMCECVCLFICVCFLCFSPAFSTFSLLILSYSSWFSYFILFYYLVLDASLLYISLCGATEFARCLRAQRVWVQFPTLTQQHTVIFNSTSKICGPFPASSYVRQPHSIHTDVQAKNIHIK